MPMAWFLYPLLLRLKRMVKPATTKTARAMQTVTAKMPRQCMEALLAGLDDGCTAGFERSPAGGVQPTRRTANNLVWSYNIAKASVVSSILSLQKADVTKGPRGKLLKGLAKRGLGASRLNLSRANEKRRLKAKTISVVAGTLSFTYVEPKHQTDMGTLVLGFLVLTMDANGHITWPSNFSANSRAILRKAVRLDLKKMMDDALYPVHKDMEKAMPGMSDSVHIFGAPTPAPAAGAAAPM